MHKFFPHLLLSLIFAIMLFLFPSWNEVYAYSTDAETQGVILYVKPGANGTCASWADACELQTALFNAVAGDQIWVAAGTYKPTTSSNREATIQLKNDVAIFGGFPSAGGDLSQRDWETNTTTISGDIGIVGNNDDNSYHVVTGSGVGVTTILNGFTISGGNANGTSPNVVGGGMFNSGGSPTLTNVTFSGNSATNYGGGMYNSGSPTLTNVTFSSNSATYGGGMYNTNSSPTLSNITFSDNTASNDGGGMYNTNSSPTLSNITFSGNTAFYYGGGMYNNNSSSPSLTNVTFSGNTAINGGGMYNTTNSSPTLYDVNFSDNTATNYGGGMYNFNSSSPTLYDVTYSGNTASKDGGGMYNFTNSSPRLTNVTFSGNTAINGGGMYNTTNSSPSLTNVTFSNNSATYGGGMYNTNSSPTLTNVTFSTNSETDYGGGMYNYRSSPSLSNVTLSGNSAIYDGGGMYNTNSSPTLTNVTFSSNSVTYGVGGGMYNTNSSPSLTNVTFSGNYGTLGGGMYNTNSSPTLTNVTFSGNTTVLNGGGMYNTNSSPTLTNAILWGNTGSQITGSATVTYSDIQGGYAGVGNINTAPLLGSLLDNGGFTQTLALGEGSPAIDVGNPESCPGFDQRYYARPADGNGDGITGCDMGAYEYGASIDGFLLSVEVSGSGTVLIDPQETGYFYGDVVNLTAIADENWIFTGWSGDASGTDNPLSVTMDAIKNITANFLFDELVLNVMVNPDGTGSVMIDPVKTTYHYGDVVTLTSVTNPGWSFAGWTGDASGTTNPLTVTMTSNKSITANFTQDEYSLSVSVNPPGMGSVTKSPSKPVYYYGEVVTLTASPTVTGWRFTGWSADASGVTNPLQVTITSDTNITANFSNQYALSTIVDPPDSGTITRDINQDTYSYGTQVVLTASPNLGWTFTGWGGDASGTDNPLTITILGDTNITATFTQDEYTLTVTPVGSGTVAVDPVQATYHYGDVVTLTPTADPGWTFGSWSGDASGTDNPLAYTVVGDTNITAAFTQDEYTLTITPIGSGTVSIDPIQATHHYGDVVTLTPTSDPGWTFAGWGGDANGSEDPLIYTIIGNTTITATFTLDEYSLTVTSLGSGTVYVDPVQASYHYGDLVTLTPTANPGWTFSGWSGDASGFENPLTYTIVGNTNITATFTQDEYILTVTPIGSGTVSIDPFQATYHYGDVVTLTPTADPGWTFTSWTGDATGSDNPLTYMVVGNTTIIATFSQDEYTLTVTPIGSGMVTIDPVQATYHYGDIVTLTPSADPGWTFDGWNEDASGSDIPLSYTIIGNTSITATFTQNEYTLAIDIAPVESGTVIIFPIQTTYHYGDEVTLTPVANPGWTFSEWSGDATGSDNPLTVTIFGDTNITANFTQDQYALAVTIEGSGSVAIDPIQATYIYGTEVTLTATAGPSWSFAGWGGDANGSDNPLTFTIQGNTSITALFTTNWIYLPMITR